MLFRFTLILSLLCALMLPASAQVELPPVPIQWTAKGQANYVLSLCQDLQGQIWVGTDDAGVWRYTPQTRKWTQFTTKDGLGDNDAYALTCDAQGRIWAGSLRHGVAVFNGRAWKTYDAMEGPIGERIFALATSPVDGDVWMATSAGLSHYGLSSGKWTHYTQQDGLPSMLATCLAFDSIGTLYVGTQTDGLAIGKADTNYQQWENVRGPDAVPNAATGEGLPSNLINDVLVSEDETVYVATTTGLARSSDFGASWTFTRGSDWDEKIKGLKPPQTPDPTPITKELLREDYVSCLAEDQNGMLWIGYRMKGWEARRPLTDFSPLSDAGQETRDFPYVSAILPIEGYLPLVGYYQQGVKPVPQAPSWVPNAREREYLAKRRGWKRPDAARINPAQTVSFPVAATAPTWDELRQMQEELKRVPILPLSVDSDYRNPMVVALPDDWTTQGTWLGRYGKYWAVLFASVSPDDYEWGSGYGAGADKKPSYWIQIGPNRAPGDKVRRWIHWNKTRWKRSLEIPNPHLHARVFYGYNDWPDTRRQSEADDHGEAYPLTLDGPDLYATIQIPAGQYVLSLYDINKDGLYGFNRARDYTLSVRPEPWVAGNSIGAIETFEQWPEAARGRIRDFRGGVWKKFLVNGPCYLAVKVGRNYSFNTILAAAMLDKVDPNPAPYSRSYTQQTVADANDRGVRVYAANESEADYAAQFANNSSENWTAWNVYHALDFARNRNPMWWARNGRRYQLALARWFEQAWKTVDDEKVPRYFDRLAVLYYRTHQYEKWEAILNRQKATTPREIEKSLFYDGKAMNLSGAAATLIERWQDGTLEVASKRASLKNIDVK